MRYSKMCYWILVLPIISVIELIANDDQGYNNQEELIDIIHDESDEFLREVDEELKQVPRKSTTSQQIGQIQQLEQVKKNINLIEKEIDLPTRKSTQKYKKQSKQK